MLLFSFVWFVDAEHILSVKQTKKDESQTGEVHSGIFHSRQIPVLFRSRYDPHSPFQLPLAPRPTFPSLSTIPLASLLSALVLTHMDHRG